MMILVYGLLAVSGLFALFAVALLVTELMAVNRLMDLNKQLMILVAGKDEKPESTLRALVALDKPPQKKLKGIADGKKEAKKPTNTDYQMTIGV